MFSPQQIVINQGQSGGNICGNVYRPQRRGRGRSPLLWCDWRENGECEPSKTPEKGWPIVECGGRKAFEWPA